MLAVTPAMVLKVLSSQLPTLIGEVGLKVRSM